MLKIQQTFILIFIVSSCHLHKVKDNEYSQSFSLENQFSLKQTKHENTEDIWYKTFKNSELNKLIEKAFANNFNLKRAWSSLKQAQINAKLAGTDLRPTINASVLATQRNIDNNTNNSESVRFSLGWELDIWKKIKNTQGIQLTKYHANEAIYQNTALILSAAIANNYFSLQSKLALQKNIKDLLHTNNLVIDYLNNQQAITGIGSSIRLQNSKISYLQLQDKLVGNKQNIRLLQQSLAILLGKSPIEYKFLPKQATQALPPLPNLPNPQELINTNNLLKESWQEVREKDYNIAIKLASRLPQLSINSNYSISNDSLNFSINDFLFSISVNLIQSLYDGGRKKLRLKISKEEFQETLYEFNDTYLKILQDIEAALTTEQYLVESLRYQKKSTELANDNITKAHFLYSRAGNVSFQELLNDIISSTNTKERLINVSENLLKARVALHLALGNNIIQKKE